MHQHHRSILYTGGMHGDCSEHGFYKCFVGFAGCKWNLLSKAQKRCNLIILFKIFPRILYKDNPSKIYKMSEQNSNQSAPETNKENQTTNKPKLKVLAFHGYRQNGAIFRAKIGSFRKAINKYAQLFFISAPHKVANDEGGGDEDARSWWFNAEDNTFSGKCLGGPAIGFEDTLRLVEEVVKDHGPFDGFMGFSQGACLVGLLAAMQQKGFLPYTFKFAVFASGFRSGSLVHKGFYDEDIKLPSIHVYGESDSIIPKEMSESLISLFVSPAVVEHSGGHYVASSGSVKDAYLDFFHDRYQDLLDEQKEKERKDSSSNS